LDRLANLFSNIDVLPGAAATPRNEKHSEVWKRDFGISTSESWASNRLRNGPGERRGDWSLLRGVGDALVAKAKREQEIEVFGLNYDSLLDAGIARALEGRDDAQLMDEFSGWNVRGLSVAIADGGLTNLLCHRWRESTWKRYCPVIRLHHVHGSGQWVRYQGGVYKCKSVSDMRDAKIYEK
jgi:hypothetical protein